MKQNITTEQLNELGEKGKKRLRKWWKPLQGDYYVFNCNLDSSKPKDYASDIVHDCGAIDTRHENDDDSLPLLSIGEMIEFLGDSYNQHISPLAWRGDVELCDSLWEAVKEILEK